MDKKDWLIIQTLYEESSINKTAETIYMSQPSITYRIQQIEDELGLQILWRSKTGIQFTPAGEHLFQYSKRMLIEYQKMKDLLMYSSSQSKGLIRLGVSGNFAHYRLPQLIKSFLKEYDNVQFQVVTGWSSEVYKLLQNEKVHVALISGDYHWGGTKTLMAEENLAIIYNDKFKVDDLLSMDYISYSTSKDLSRNSVKKDPLIKQIIDNWWLERFSTHPVPAMKIDRVETCIEMVQQGLGFSIVPSISLNSSNSCHTIILKSKNNIVPYRQTWALLHNKIDETPYLREFHQFLEKQSDFPTP